MNGNADSAAKSEQTENEMGGWGVFSDSSSIE